LRLLQAAKIPQSLAIDKPTKVKIWSDIVKLIRTLHLLCETIHFKRTYESTCCGMFFAIWMVHWQSANVLGMTPALARVAIMRLSFWNLRQNTNQTKYSDRVDSKSEKNGDEPQRVQQPNLGRSQECSYETMNRTRPFCSAPHRHQLTAND
jgi:hypothetical protein